MKKNKFFLAFALAFLSSGCASMHQSKMDAAYTKTPAPLPYLFQVESFLDRRAPEGDARLVDVLNPRPIKPFDQHLFLKSLVNRINGNPLYENQSATLRLELKDYAGFKDDYEHTVSFYVDVTGFDGEGHVLATGLYSCFAKKDARLYKANSLKKFFKTDQDPQIPSTQGEDIWGDLYSQCLNDIAYEFNTKVLEWHQRRR